MQEEADELCLIGDKLFGGRVAHPKPALTFYQAAWKRGNKKALVMIIRYMISLGHYGLKKRRPAVIEFCRSAACFLGPRYMRMLALLLLEHRETAGALILIEHAADKGDIAAQFLSGLNARSLGKDRSDLRDIERGYRYLTESAISGCVEAMTALGNALMEDGYADAGLKLLLKAVKRGSLVAWNFIFGHISHSEMNFQEIQTPLANLSRFSLGRVLSFGDPSTAWGLAELLSGRDEDPILAVRLFRRSFRAPQSFRILLFGERLWDAWRFEYLLGYALPLGSRRLPDIERVPLTGSFWD